MNFLKFTKISISIIVHCFILTDALHTSDQRFDAKSIHSDISTIDFNEFSVGRQTIFIANNDPDSQLLLHELLLKRLSQESLTTVMILSSWRELSQPTHIHLHNVNIWCDATLTITTRARRWLRSANAQLFLVQTNHSTIEKNRMIIESDELAKRLQLQVNVVFVDEKKDDETFNTSITRILPAMSRQTLEVVARNFEPFVTIDEGKLIGGLEVMLLETIAERLGMQINYLSTVDAWTTNG